MSGCRLTGSGYFAIESGLLNEKLAVFVFIFILSVYVNIKCSVDTSKEGVG